MAFVLALNNRGFSEIGVNSLKAQDMTETSHQDAIRISGESVKTLAAAVEGVESSTKESIQELTSRLNALEAER